MIHPKINLGLHILGLRPDGYHDIETLFYPYEGLSDRLDIARAGSCSLVFSGPVKPDWAPESDLTMKAYRMLRDDFDLPPVRIRLEKNIPVGAGLGGGSADAVGALRLLSELFSLGLDTDSLLGYAARLGSDCAFFVLGKPCIGSGRGEILTPYGLDLDAYEIHLVTPDIHVSTADAYAGAGGHEGVSLREALSRPVEEWKDCLVNDFEKTVFAVHPGIARLKQEYYAGGAVYASMSGSGSSVFGIFRRD